MEIHYENISLNEGAPKRYEKAKKRHEGHKGKIKGQKYNGVEAKQL